MSFSVKDFLAGWGGGMCGLLIGHPLDTIKVRQQVYREAGLLKILTSTLKQEGFLTLYKGMLFPLLSAGVQNSVFFGVYGNTLRVLQSKQGADIERKTCGEGSVPNKYWHLNVYFSGFIAAYVQAFITCPIDLIKIKLQSERVSKEKSKFHLKMCLRKIYNHSGIFGFYQGYISTLLRDVPVCGLYVLFYEHLLVVFRSHSDRSNEYTLFTQFIAGGLSGCTTWAFVTPLDVVKSRIQADDIANPKYKGVVDCVIKSYKESGISVFGRGAWIQILRGFPVNAATFAGYEWFRKMFIYFQ